MTDAGVCQTKHERPVHFNRGSHGHVWICCHCCQQLSGPKLEDDVIEALIVFVEATQDYFEKRKKKSNEVPAL